MLDELPLALASGNLALSLGFSPSKEEVFFQTALAEALRKEDDSNGSAQAGLFFSSCPLAQASGNSSCYNSTFTRSEAVFIEVIPALLSDYPNTSFTFAPMSAGLFTM